MDEPNRLTKTKEQWAKARRGGEEREVFYEGDARLPPGQHLVETFPVLDLGFKPDVPLTEWSLTIGGFVTTPVTWTWVVTNPPMVRLHSVKGTSGLNPRSSTGKVSTRCCPGGRRASPS